MWNNTAVFSDVHVRYNVVVRPSVVCRLSVCNVRAPYSAVAIEIFGNVSKPFGTLAIC